MLCDNFDLFYNIYLKSIKYYFSCACYFYFKIKQMQEISCNSVTAFKDEARWCQLSHCYIRKIAAVVMEIYGAFFPHENSYDN